MKMENLYKEKKNEYFINSRYDLIQFIPKNDQNKILEIGAGTGATLVEIKKQKLAKEVVGIELIQINDSYQNNKEINKFIIGNIEEINLDFPENYFDVIICADVIEHLNNPWDVTFKLRKYLKEDGILIASIPNIREIKTIFNIFLLGDFNYSKEGILDKTHLRFFCKKNIYKMFKIAEYGIIDIKPLFYFDKFSERRLFNLLTIKIFENLLAYQYLVIAKK